MVPVFRLTVFFALITSVSADGTLDALANAAERFAVAIQQQMAAVRSITSATEVADKTISYANFICFTERVLTPSIKKCGHSHLLTVVRQLILPLLSISQGQP
jgi:hypothetical protein